MYHDLITEKSWNLLQELKRKYEFILIGGWAVYLYTKGLKSRDIDFICDYETLEHLRTEYEVIKNDRLKKYEIHAGEFDIDIYLPFYSELGIPLESLQKMTSTIEGFLVPNRETLLILKQKAFENRRGSNKGKKDRLDILSLVKEYFDFKKYSMLIGDYNLSNFKNNLQKLIEETREIKELSINAHQWARIKVSLLKELD